MDGGEYARPNGDDLTADEVRAAIGALTDQDWRILYLVERRYRAGTDFAEGDLLQEALCLAFERQRRCPRDVGFVRTLSLMMRSAGFHRRKAMSRQVGFDAPVVAGKDGGMLAPAETLQAPGMSPETAIMEKRKGPTSRLQRCPSSRTTRTFNTSSWGSSRVSKGPRCRPRPG